MIPPMKDRTPLDEATLVSQLNALLTSLRISIPLISPTDLTPRLLIAILESFLAMRIPVFERQDDSQVSKVQNMKLFLGVLETDILKVDVGLSQIDPRRLACGEREEVIFIAELLCWIGRRRKLIEPQKIKASADALLGPLQARELQSSSSFVTPTIQRTRSDSSPAYKKPLFPLDVDKASASQTGSTWTDHSTPPTNSPFANRPFYDESFTSLNSDDHILLQAPFRPEDKHKDSEITDDDALSSVSDILGGLNETLSVRKREPPRCIHEIATPSIHGSPAKLPSTPPRKSTSNFSRNWSSEHPKDSFVGNSSGWSETSPPIRYSGYIKPVDEESEIASFELTKSFSTTTSERSAGMLVQDRPMPTLKSVQEQYTRTRELLNERARLLTHLAELKNQDPFE